VTKCEKKKKKASAQDIQALKNIENFVINSFTMRADTFSNCLGKLLSDLTNEIVSKEKTFWDSKAKEKFENYDKTLKKIMSATVKGVNLYTNAFLVH
jgi:hypothetical protein